VQTDTHTDVMMEKEKQSNATTTKTTCYSTTKRRVEESNRMYARKVEEDAKKMREKKKAQQHSDAGVKKSTRQRFDGKGCDEDLSSSEAFERRIKRECENILKRLKSSFNTSS